MKREREREKGMSWHGKRERERNLKCLYFTYIFRSLSLSLDFPECCCIYYCSSYFSSLLAFCFSLSLSSLSSSFLSLSPPLESGASFSLSLFSSLSGFRIISLHLSVTSLSLSRTIIRLPLYSYSDRISRSNCI